MNLAIWIERAARADPGRPALASGPEVGADYATLARRVRGLAASLTGGFGLAVGDRIGILSDNRTEIVEVLFAAWHAGLIVVPINARLHRDEVAYILAHSGTRLVFADAGHADTAAAAGAERVVLLEGDGYRETTAGPGADLFDCGPDHPAWLFYTSGTTGRPKGATLSHRNLQAMTLGYLADVDRIDATDSLLHAAPMSHGSGLYILPHVCRGAVNVVPASGGFDPAEILELAECWRGATLFAAPTMVKRLVRHLRETGEAVPAGLKSIVYGGAPMYVQDVLEAPRPETHADLRTRREPDDDHHPVATRYRRAPAPTSPPAAGLGWPALQQRRRPHRRSPGERAAGRRGRRGRRARRPGHARLLAGCRGDRRRRAGRLASHR
jgi:long-chain acyl-CoA synthetase